MGKRKGDMGCYPLRKMMSKAFGRCSGDERRRHSTRMVYTPPPMCSHTRTVVKTVTFSNDNPVVVNPPERNNGSTVAPNYHPEPAISPSCSPRASSSSKGYGSGNVDNPKKPAPNQPEPPPPPPPDNPPATPTRHQPIKSYRYVPSPLPRWEYGARRWEYFGGEYAYYPTPIREGIYSIATDPGTLTALFSEENPNACTIV